MKLLSRRDEKHEFSAADGFRSPLESAGIFLRQPAIIATVQRRPESAPIHRLASVLMDSHFAQGRRGLAVCGVNADAGVVGVASNISAAISMQGSSVLLADVNMSQFNNSEKSTFKPGISDIVSDDSVLFQDVVLKGVIPGLDILPYGSKFQHDIFEGDGFYNLSRKIVRLYECSILCAPPANRSSSALTVARAMGHAVIVARASRTFYDDLLQISRELRKDGVNILGSIMVES